MPDLTLFKKLDHLRKVLLNICRKMQPVEIHIVTFEIIKILFKRFAYTSGFIVSGRRIFG